MYDGTVHEALAPAAGAEVRSGKGGSGMADGSPPKMLLIVTGSTLRAEELDRPLAYYLKQQVERHPATAEFGADGLQVRGVADLLLLNDDEWPRPPRISVGAPGLNHLPRHWFEDLP